MKTISCPRREWTDISHYLRQSTLIVIALLLGVLEAGLLTSNAIGSFGRTKDEPADVTRHQANLPPSASRPDPGIKIIDALLKKFEIDPARRKRVAEAIVRSSRRHNLDPRLVASIVIVESRGDPFAISPSNAVGIMQIHVPTWAHTIDHEGINLFKIEDNIDFGVRILRDYVARYGDDEGIKRYNGWNPDSPESMNAEAYLEKVRHIYLSSSPD